MDYGGHHIKSISMDRSLVTITAYENLLVVAYHEGVPMWGSQCIAMNLYFIDSNPNQIKIVNSNHIPVRPTSTLTYLQFSEEGMLISRDSSGQIRAYSL